VLTGGFSEVNRAQRIAVAQGGIPRRVHRMAGARTQCLYRAALSRLLAQGRTAAQDPSRPLPARQRTGRPQARHQCRLRRSPRVTELTILATVSSWLLSIIAGACASAGANIVDAQIYTTTDGARARHHRDQRGNTTATRTKAGARRGSAR